VSHYPYSKFGSTLVKQDTRRDINPALLSVEEELRLHHEPIVTASFAQSLPGTTPTPGAVGPFIYLTFSLDNDAAFRQFKIPNAYVSDPNFHIHWTKTSDANDLGKAVRWRVTYIVFRSSPTVAGDANITPTVVEVEDTYDDSGTTSRNVYRTPNTPMVGFVANYYVSMKIEAITPVGAALSANPALFSLDVTFNEYINKAP